MGSRNQGESESAINHRETPGGEVEALPIGARDRLALACRIINLAGTSLMCPAASSSSRRRSVSRRSRAKITR